MKKISSKLTVTCLVLMLAAISTLPVFAADGLKINGTAEAQAGDKVKLTLNLADASEEIIGFELRLFYDPEKLTFNEDSFSAPQFEGCVVNDMGDGKIYMTWTDLYYPANFSSKSEFFSCEFEAAGDGETELSFFVNELYGESMFNTGAGSTHLSSYTFTYDLYVNDEAQISDGVMPISNDPDTLENHQGSFINYLDGKGEMNSPLHGSEHEAVVGSTLGAADSGSGQEPVDVTRDNNGGLKPFQIFLFIGVPVFIILIVVAVVFVVKNNRKSQ